MATTVKKELKNKKKPRKKVPRALIYEMRKGSPIYYRDYDKVLKGELSLEAVMGSSGLQAWLIDIIITFLKSVLDKSKYIILTNEVGYKFAPRSWYNLDIAIWEKDKVKPYLTQDKLIPVAPEVVIEIDTKADLRKFENPQDYFHRKTQDLLDSGVKKVIWIFTKDKKIWIAENKKPWLIVDFDYEVPVMDKIKFNLKKLIEEEGQNV
ncbi:Uma2 family endonuclease [Persephonella sp.]|uniref:Uma2 family endonuclease n=1 Tax=Persephonella sp. TaxID=2060922 RepID=UPI002624B68D|nr:Uma2 family endonuclease [Persephonella sp.]